jgi:predicted DsbA family dithiol-disulfide isomerase
MVKLDIFSDPVCPWCYIGKTNLDTALARMGDHPFEIAYHPFQLNPEMPPEGMDRRAYLDGKFGGREGAEKAYRPVREHADKAGLTIDFEGIARTPNTLDAHRLIHWAGIEQRQGEVVQALFEAYFTEGRDIGSHDTLCDIADSAGMDAAVVARLLASGADADEIRNRDTEARKMGVQSVPTFIVAGQHAVPGAQPPDLWVEVAGEIMAKLEDAGDAQ